VGPDSQETLDRAQVVAQTEPRWSGVNYPVRTPMDMGQGVVNVI
jgi:hypothetical protein